MLTVKNKQTGRAEAIVQENITHESWGFRFFTTDELAAYKAAYEYRNSKYGVEVSFAGGVKKWQVTVFNAVAVDCGITRGK